jgi:hypothetical protein
VCTVTQNEDDGDAHNEHVEPGIPGAFPDSGGHGGGVLLTAARPWSK